MERSSCIYVCPNGYRMRYPMLFWEEHNRYVRAMAPWELARYLDALRRARLVNIRSETIFRSIVRKMVERLSCFEGALFLTPEEVREFLTKERLWVPMDERREMLWKRYAGLDDGFRPRYVRAGKRMNSDGC